MAISLSPDVQVNEVDLTTIVPSVSSTTAAYCGDFQWGECFTPTLVDQESTLINKFFYPNDRNAKEWFSAWNYLNYSNSLYVVRVIEQTNANTQLIARNATSSNNQGITVYNTDHYYNNYANGQLDTLYTSGPWVAKWPGQLGNSLKISVCASANAFQSTLSGTISVAAGNTTVTGVGTEFSTELSNSDIIVINSEQHRIASIANSTSLTLKDRHIIGASANTCQRYWRYYSSVNLAPSTTQYANNYSVSGDELHIVIVDEDGQWTGTPGEILETFPNLSQASDAVAENGTSIYYKNWINGNSKYIWWASHSTLTTNAGKNISLGQANTFVSSNLPMESSLVGGNDGIVPTNADRMRGYDLFNSPDTTDITTVISGPADATLVTYLINNIAEKRKDCVVFVSPPMTSVVNNIGYEYSASITFRNLLPSSSYAFMDCNWKYQYDKFNDTYRWVPMNGDIAGLYAQTATNRDPWWAFAGFNRGNIKNLYKLAWNPRKSERDELYKNGINPVCSFPGMGTVLYGNKTLLAAPSAFNQANIRMLFIVLEKAIAKAAKYFLFEFNDTFTQASFRNMVNPYLRDVQGRRGIQAFLTVCDSTNNTAEVVDNNDFVADIYLKPTHAIGNISLNFVASRTSVSFSEIVGQTGSR